MRRVLAPLAALLATVAMPLAAQETSAAAAPNKVAGFNRVKISSRPSAGLYAGSLMKLQGHDSAREFTRRIDEQIARAGGALTDSLPHTNASEVASSEMRSIHSRTRFAPDVIDRTRRQR